MGPPRQAPGGRPGAPDRQRRASLEEVAGSILEWTEQNHPDALKRTTAEIDAFLAELPQPIATPADEFVAELHAVLPQRWARKAERI